MSKRFVGKQHVFLFFFFSLFFSVESILRNELDIKFGSLEIINWERRVVEWIGRDQFPLQLEFGFQFDTKNGDSIFGKKKLWEWNHIYYFMWPFYYRSYYFMWHLNVFLFLFSKQTHNQWIKHKIGRASCRERVYVLV